MPEANQDTWSAASLKTLIQEWAQALNLEYANWMYVLLVLGLIALTAAVLHGVMHGSIYFMSRRVGKESPRWLRALHNHRPFSRLAMCVQGVVLLMQANIWLAPGLLLESLAMVAELWILLFALLSVFALFNTLEEMLMDTSLGRSMPLRGISQSLKLIAALMAIIFAISLLTDKSPVLLLSGLGAMTAVLLLVFKDAILGFVAGIQLSANRMLLLGDWLEMPKYGADGDVIDIGLTTVKVRNWDNTITTLPTYALISDSFKNWRGMSESGGRRIKRSVFIDATSVKFLQQEDIQRLRRAALLSDYIEQKISELSAENQQLGVDMNFAANGRRLTNLGTFRAYLGAYLNNSKHIHKGMTCMVRQLETRAEGIPLEIYAFTNDTRWAVYEGIQADIFDHIFAVLPEFGLHVYQTPTGHDLLQLAEPLKSLGRAPT